VEVEVEKIKFLIVVYYAVQASNVFSWKGYKKPFLQHYLLHSVYRLKNWASQYVVLFVV